jgi:hypothetical protein
MYAGKYRRILKVYTCGDDGNRDENPQDPKGHDGEEVMEELLLLDLEPAN